MQYIIHRNSIIIYPFFIIDLLYESNSSVLISADNTTIYWPENIIYMDGKVLSKDNY